MRLRILLSLGLVLIAAGPVFAGSTISRDGSCAAATTSCTFGATNTYSLKIIYAHRDGSNTPPSLPAGWTTITTIQAGAGGTLGSVRVGCNYSTSSSDTGSGTWTNATEVVGMSYSGVNVDAGGCNSINVIGTGTSNSAKTSSTINYAAVTLADAGGTSWLIGLAGHSSASNVNTAPSGMTNVTSAGTGPMSGASDTNAATSSNWTSTNVTVNSSGTWESYVTEIRACLTTICYKNFTTGNGAGSAGTVASAAGVHSAHNLLVAMISSETGGVSVSGVANTASDTWAACAGAAVVGGGTYPSLDIWYASNSNGNTADIVTVTYSGNTTNRGVTVVQYSGAALTSPCETAKNTTALTAASITTPSFSPANSGNVNVVIGTTDGGGNWTAGTGYTLIQATNSFGGGVEHKLNAAAGSQTASFTPQNTSNLAIGVASFKAGSIAGQVGAFLVGP